MRAIGIYWRTVRHLTCRQLWFQVWHRLRVRGRLRVPERGGAGHWLAVSAVDTMISDSYQPDSNTVTSLNQSVSFPERIDWNYASNGKLWTYHLNYFDFLNQPGLNASAGLRLIRDFVSQSDTILDGLEAYPTSLRVMNWIRFLSRNQIYDHRIDTHLFAQTARLRGRLEHHLGGNHLLENSFALLLASLYFRHRRWFRKARSLVRTELKRQILPDGGHAERSPSYHNLLLEHLTCLTAALRVDTWHSDPALSPFLENKADNMRNWLSAITFQNGDCPVINDCIPLTAQPTASLTAPATQLSHSGYYFFRQPQYELFVDAGAVGFDQQPGHAHADTFNFVLHVRGEPLIVDVGTSTYEPGERRQWERSTAAHNTVEVAGQNSSEVWSNFRVGRRARVTVLDQTNQTLTARHDGYRHLGLIHERAWTVAPDALTIYDQLHAKAGCATHQSTARFYFHPDQVVSRTDETILVRTTRLLFTSSGSIRVRLTAYKMADGFNRLRPACCVEVDFTGKLSSFFHFSDDNPVPDILF
ncbi:heparinase II/III family protein [Spirosoma montaniterrae]|uniref:Uncharacterized protein n=1 Tax=Spirosoma montaniterrae TaxID=1178516 RepID=A0A1P9WYX4_9BACT|nr:heparinase II/III-family protein [Spirosoma montaniterrae]AQG80577.1 hypothetical protein AWR27_15360 [Spirosoma montaniterrae]